MAGAQEVKFWQGNDVACGAGRRWAGRGREVEPRAHLGLVAAGAVAFTILRFLRMKATGTGRTNVGGLDAAKAAWYWWDVVYKTAGEIKEVRAMSGGVSHLDSYCRHFDR